KLSKIKALWMLKWTTDHVSADIRWQLFFEFNIWMLNQLDARVPFTIFEFIMDIDLVAFQQSMLGLLDHYLDIANNYFKDSHVSSLEKYVGERIIVSHLLNLIIQHPELIS
ncbi:5396_t:CDS:2, partial [Scutellospora calospora]